MKKNFKKIFMILLFVAVILGGKKVIDFKTFNYEETVNSSLTSFYVKGEIKYLEPVIKILEKYKTDSNKRDEIQNYSYTIVKSWFSYLDSKYTCDFYNLNSCKTQLEEFKLLNAKLNKLYDYKCTDGYTIIIPSSYTNLKVEGEKKVKGLENIIKNPNSKNPDDSEQLRLKKCLSAVECENCRDNVCKCYYIDKDMNREEITCKSNNVK